MSRLRILPAAAAGAFFLLPSLLAGVPAEGNPSSGTLEGVREIGSPAVLPDTLPPAEELALRFAPDGDPDLGRMEIVARAAEARPHEATLWIQLLAVLDRVDRGVAPTVVRAVGLGDAGEGLRGAELLMEAAPEARPRDAASLLALAALLAEAEDPLRAAEIRARLLEEHPDAPETPEATVRQARWLVSMSERRDEGLRLLEELIVARPGHPVVPEARRLFQQEGGRAQGTPENPR